MQPNEEEGLLRSAALQTANTVLLARKRVEQELRAAQGSGVTYWEGAIDVRGRGVKGRGYLEMTGYAGEPMGHFLR